MDNQIFIDKVKAGFSFLTQKYDFSGPEVKDYGREVFVCFHRNDETVSVSMEMGSEPIVEMLLLCEGNEGKPVPWAERNGRQRFRKFPQLRDIKDFFAEAPSQFEEKEKVWLES